MSPRALDVTEVEELSSDELGAALLEGAECYSWDYRAAVGLVVGQRRWLSRWEFRQAVEVDVCEAGLIVAWVDWSKVDMTGPASGGELRVLELARSLAGIVNTRPLGDLLTSLDEGNLNRVLEAVEVACWGRLR